MRKYKVAVGALLLAGCSMTFTSCIGSFSLTNKVLAWNNQVSNKFVNELVFIAFCILPVYEVTAIADLLVINSIEFWSGRNPMTASTKAIDTEQGRYLIDCDGRGYTVTFEPTGSKTRLEFIEENNSWAYVSENGDKTEFMTFLDDNHVKMTMPDGNSYRVELSEQGVMAYHNVCRISEMAMR